MSAMLNAAIADLTYLVSGKIGRDYRDGSPFVLAQKGDTFSAIERGVAALREARQREERAMSDMMDIKTAQARVAQLEEENAALGSENTRLREALRPFADYADRLDGFPDVAPVRYAPIGYQKDGGPIAYDCRKARAALAPS